MKNNNFEQESKVISIADYQSKSATEDNQMETPMEFFTFLDQLVTNTASETQKFIEKTTLDVGKTLQSISENSFIQALKKVFGADWLMMLLGEVDVEKIETHLAKLKEKYPDKTKEELAQQIILDKAWEAGKVGLVTNIIPPVAVALLGIELAATAKLQAEMVYEMAGIHGLDLREPARRGEVLIIFALSLGTGALKTGASLIEIIPGVGAVIGASTNAIILYALGYTANQFYQGKYSYFSPTLSSDTQQQEQENYWDVALQQSKIMDEILVHMILASYPEKGSWEEILRNLEEVSPSSVKVVATKLENPQPLQNLLDKLSPDFAILTLNRCYSLALLDEKITPQEQKIIDTIAEKFDLDTHQFEN